MPTVFYRDPDLVITDDVFAVWNPEPQVYDLEGLDRLRVEHNGRPARIVLLVAGALATVGAAAVLTYTYTDAAGPYVITAAMLSVSPLTNRAMRAFTPVVWLLRARYADADVTLFSTTSAMSVMRVRRCLMRAFAANAASVERLDRAGYAEAYRRLNSLL
ncbi:DUF6232 family protein [Dactylosporangium sp. NPDC051485]|uniref:DUF6232 family protein n=1 Tax=Dactylosporangium sp. NPDC051485 TaxID=3154846 RepID=UPI00343C66D7